MRLEKIFITILCLIATLGFSQNAITNYGYAKEECNKGNYNNALNYITSIENELGGKTIKTQTLKVICYYELKSWVKAQVAINEFNDLTAGVSLPYETKTYLNDIKSQIAIGLTNYNKEFKENKQKIKDDNLAKVNADIDNKYKADKLLFDKKTKEFNDFKAIADNPTPQNIKGAIDNNSPYSYIASKYLDSAYTKEIIIGDEAFTLKNWNIAYTHYLNAKKWKETAAVNSRIYSTEAELDYIFALNSSDYQDWEKFIDTYPWYSSTPLYNKLANYYITEGKREYRKVHYYEASQNFDGFIKRFGTDKRYKYAIRMKARADKRAETKSYFDDHTAFSLSIGFNKKMGARDTVTFTFDAFKINYSYTPGYYFGLSSNLWRTNEKNDFIQDGEYRTYTEITDGYPTYIKSTYTPEKNASKSYAVAKFGFVERIVLPLFIYAGAGIGYYTYRGDFRCNNDEYDTSSNVIINNISTDVYSSSLQNRFTYVVDFGVLLQGRYAGLKYGCNYIPRIGIISSYGLSFVF